MPGIKKYYTFDCFANFKLTAAVSTRVFKNMSLFYGATNESLENRKAFLSRLGIDHKDLVALEQIHSHQVVYVTEKDKGKGALTYQSAIPAADALITDQKNTPLAVFTADCLSIFFFDLTGSGIGLVHAGWRSSKAGIVGKTIKLMQDKFKTNTEDLHVAFGPAIRNCCYRVGGEFNQYFSDSISSKEGINYLDLAAENKKQLLASGVKAAHIFDSGICTFCRNDEFFSYRKESGNCGRMISVMMLR